MLRKIFLIQSGHLGRCGGPTTTSTVLLRRPFSSSSSSSTGEDDHKVVDVSTILFLLRDGLPPNNLLGRSDAIRDTYQRGYVRNQNEREDFIEYDSRTAARDGIDPTNGIVADYFEKELDDLNLQKLKQQYVHLKDSIYSHFSKTTFLYPHNLSKPFPNTHPVVSLNDLPLSSVLVDGVINHTPNADLPHEDDLALIRAQFFNWSSSAMPSTYQHDLWTYRIFLSRLTPHVYEKWINDIMLSSSDNNCINKLYVYHADLHLNENKTKDDAAVFLIDLINKIGSFDLEEDVDLRHTILACLVKCKNVDDVDQHVDGLATRGESNSVIESTYIRFLISRGRLDDAFSYVNYVEEEEKKKKGRRVDDENAMLVLVALLNAGRLSDANHIIKQYSLHAASSNPVD